MASSRAPRLIDLTWGDPAHPKVTLVGKGVCFDTGGLDLKPSAGMLIMKKDMGGAANVLALAQMVMDAGAEGALAGADSGGRERGRRQRLPPARYLPFAQGPHAWRSAIPTPKAGWCWPMRWRWPTKKSPIC